ncbi:helix-turn-helix transcriptional regulator [Tamlana fucoidanivorans]|uniref:Helix-turn-helix transcriptional regulator n=1 Tax=Allotamlana fucoidanivorans TaxID=2583814 RepID=A0A5C4SQK1_9FLAO|nr:helix-turn-helix transcriptional regulator [Tamlana fucoidanivorans]TNJ46484.1 helix-turn-helix transcriptional regulator [Tamlana fucoidanivorans]
MINNEKFVERLQNIIHYYGETASSFAEKIGVQRSSISHILSERNKPSLDFVLKVLSAYPQVDLYWLLNGKGTFPSEPKKEAPQKALDFYKKEKDNSHEDKLNSHDTPNNKEIERIVIFYSDGTFKNFNN